MASIKSHRPSEQTKTSNNNEHSFTNKVKEMAQSARKIFTPQLHQESVKNNHTQNLPSNGTAQSGVKTEKTTTTKKVKKPEGNEGNCMPKVREHVKNLKNKKNREDRHSGGSSSSDSDDEKKSKRKN